jgi:hypothetical protein
MCRTPLKGMYGAAEGAPLQSFQSPKMEQTHV